ncbi:MAG: heme o synthase [Acidobacteria bacterium]|nr:heme o synthase [Acidobacteriota bacterium]
MSVAEAIVSRTMGAVIRDYLELSKARIVMMVLITTAAGYAVGATSFDAILMVHLMLGTALVAGGTNALNQWWERELDARMARTRNRPIPSGRMTQRAALVFSSAISVIGTVWLALAVNPLAALLAFATLASYLFLYTPLKTRTTLCTIIGAAPGAVPPMIGYAAATGVVDAASWAMFGLMFAWQLPHFLALSWIYRDDYARGGFEMLSVHDHAGSRVARHAFAWSVGLFAVSLVPYWLGISGVVYLAAAVISGLGIIAASVVFARTLSMKSARQLFMGSNLYLVVVMALLVAG